MLGDDNDLGCTSFLRLVCVFLRSERGEERQRQIFFFYVRFFFVRYDFFCPDFFFFCVSFRVIFSSAFRCLEIAICVTQTTVVCAELAGRCCWVSRRYVCSAMPSKQPLVDNNRRSSEQPLFLHATPYPRSLQNNKKKWTVKKTPSLLSLNRR